ncbi:MAG: DNA helicase RecQ [Candidatus Paceibacteria bacterium]
MPKQAKQVLTEYFGYDSFRPQQEEVIETILQGHNCLVIMPTGGGKSICFQIPAIVKPGLCIVISPLISLMRDQVDDLTEKGVRAAFLNSSISKKEQNKIKQEAKQGQLDLIYTSPERLSSDFFLQFMREIERINLFAVDEAHCISAWGHDFRPEYKQISEVKNKFPSVPIVGLTATADKTTRRDIVRQMGLDPGRTKMFISSFDRPNLKLNVFSAEKRLVKIKRYINSRANESGIIYCLSRKSTEYVAEKLRGWGIDAKAYHAGLEDKVRDKRQREFIYDQTEVICATIAFGMGIDKPDIRWIIHYNLPKNIESYYQQIGRAGRDGADSEAILFYNESDFSTLKKFAQNDSRKTLQLAKLRHVEKYATSNICRRKSLLGYFGEMHGGQCSKCDVCENSRGDYFRATKLAQKILSVLARADEPLSKEIVVDILKGKRSSRVLSGDYDKLSTFGIGSDRTSSSWYQYIDQLINSGAVRYSYSAHNKLELTDLGARMLEDEAEIRLIKVSGSETDYLNTSSQIDTASTKDKKQSDSLYSSLRQLRTELSKQQDVPPYVIYHDATLEEIVQMKPLNKSELMEIQGIGRKKVKKYGGKIIKKVAQDIINNQDYIDTKKRVYSHYLLRNPLSQIADELNISKGEMYEYFLSLYGEGYDISLSDFIGAKALDEIKKLAPEDHFQADLDSILSSLNQEMNKEKLRFILTCLDG